MDELLPCPFCGGKGRKFRMLHNEVTHKISFIAEVGCDLCNAKMLGLGATPDEANDNAIKTWNTRTSKEIKDCEQCIHFGKHATEYPCSHCRNCYTDKFQPNDTRTPKERGGEK